MTATTAAPPEAVVPLEGETYVEFVPTGRSSELWVHITRISDGVATSWARCFGDPEHAGGEQ